MHLGNQLIDLVARNHNTLGLAVLCLSACIEYLFPPFPGDTITVFGAFLVARRGWSGAGRVRRGHRRQRGRLHDRLRRRPLARAAPKSAGPAAGSPYRAADRPASSSAFAATAACTSRSIASSRRCAACSSSPPAWRGCAGGWCWPTARCRRSCGTRSCCCSASPSVSRGIGWSPSAKPMAWRFWCAAARSPSCAAGGTRAGPPSRRLALLLPLLLLGAARRAHASRRHLPASRLPTRD